MRVFFQYIVVRSQLDRNAEQYVWYLLQWYLIVSLGPQERFGAQPPIELLRHLQDYKARSAAIFCM